MTTERLNSPEIEMICPECGNIGATSGKFKPKKCFFNPEKNVWHCYQCGAKGRGEAEEKKDVLFEFSDHLLTAYQSELLESTRALGYLKKRFGGLNLTSPFFGLGYDSGRDAIVIPVFNSEKKLVGVKYRSIEDRDLRYWSEPGSEAGLYGIKGTEPDVLFCEGEFDALSAYLMGFEGTILAVQTNRLSTAAKARLSAWLPVGLRKIYIAPDQDDAGSALVKALEGLQFSSDDVRVIQMPDRLSKDLSELLERHGFNEAERLFKEAISAAKPKWLESTYNVFERLPDTLSYLQDKKNTTGWSTGFQKLDAQLGGGLMPYTLTALSAPGKTGKTTFLIAVIHQLLLQGNSVGFISLEMNPTTYVIPSLLSIASKSNVRKLPIDALPAVFDQLKQEKPYLNQLSFFDRYGTTPSEEIEAWIKSQHEHAGVNLFFFDHVGYSLKDIKDPSEHSQLSKRLRSLTRTLPIHILAIVQPKSLPFGQKQVTKHDLYGSVTWSQDLNQLLTMEKTGENQVCVRLTDSHNPLARPSEDGVVLFYDAETCLISDRSPVFGIAERATANLSGPTVWNATRA